MRLVNLRSIVGKRLCPFVLCGMALVVQAACVRHSGPLGRLEWAHGPIKRHMFEVKYATLSDIRCASDEMAIWQLKGGRIGLGPKPYATWTIETRSGLLSINSSGADAAQGVVYPPSELSGDWLRLCKALQVEDPRHVEMQWSEIAPLSRYGPCRKLAHLALQVGNNDRMWSSLEQISEVEAFILASSLAENVYADEIVVINDADGQIACIVRTFAADNDDSMLRVDGISWSSGGLKSVRWTVSGGSSNDVRMIASYLARSLVVL